MKILKKILIQYFFKLNIFLKNMQVQFQTQG
jgi:hypothetical protein